MLIITACRDFALGLARGLSFFITERHDGDPSFIIPEAALGRCLRKARPREPQGSPLAASRRRSPS